MLWPATDLRKILDAYFSFIHIAEYQNLKENPLQKVMDLFFKRVINRLRDESFDLILEAHSKKRVSQPKAKPKPDASLQFSLADTLSDQASSVSLTLSSFIRRDKNLPAPKANTDTKNSVANQLEPIDNSTSSLNFNILTPNQSNIKRQKTNSLRTYHDKCNVHLDTIITSFYELSTLVDIYNKIDANKDQMLVLYLVKLMMNIKNRYNAKDYLHDDNLYFIFTSELFLNLKGKTFAAKPQPASEIENLLAFDLLSDTFLSSFVNYSLAAVASSALLEFEKNAGN